MLAEVRAKSQVTLPKALMNEVGLKQGDKIDFFVKDGMICMMPVAVYSKEYIDRLAAELAETREKLAKGEQPMYHSIEELAAALEKEE